jgi:hypothetical protein
VHERTSLRSRNGRERDSRQVDEVDGEVAQQLLGRHRAVVARAAQGGEFCPTAPIRACTTDSLLS